MWNYSGARSPVLRQPQRALAAIRQNSQMINPSYSFCNTFIESRDALVSLMGKEEALEVMDLNPRCCRGRPSAASVRARSRAWRACAARATVSSQRRHARRRSCSSWRPPLRCLGAASWDGPRGGARWTAEANHRGGLSASLPSSSTASPARAARGARRALRMSILYQSVLDQSMNHEALRISVRL